MSTYVEQKKLLEKLDPSRVRLLKDVIKKGSQDFVCLKRDVECKVKKAYKLCKIEHSLGVSATYYVQHSLLKSPKNIKLLKKMQQLGADISYHHDVMDANGGDIQKAAVDFDKKLSDFSVNGFSTDTVCQHGNPVVNRVGYSSNRDFFRSDIAKDRYPNIVDIVANMSQKTGTYTYISDYGRSWKIVLEPEKDKSEHIALPKIEDVAKTIKEKEKVVVSMHPHRLCANKFTESLSRAKFNIIRGTAKLLMKIPFFKKIMSRFYYLARKV